MPRLNAPTAVALLATLICSSATADEPDGTSRGFFDEPIGLSYETEFLDPIETAISLGVLQDDEAVPTPPDPELAEAGNTRGPRAGNFGSADTWRLNFEAGAAFADAGELYTGSIGLSYFVVDDFSIDFQVSLMQVDQEGPNAWGGGFALMVRWHFLSRSEWSLYVDAGAGFLKTNDDVPDNGSNWNFTPRAGVGVSFDVGRNWRAMTGVRWFHISNANTSDSNPGRDSIQAYAGLSIPF